MSHRFARLLCAGIALMLGIGAYIGVSTDSALAQNKGWQSRFGQARSSQSRSVNLFDVAQSNKNLTIFTTLLSRVGMEALLRNNGPYTVFAPTDAAFEAMPAGELKKLLADNNKRGQLDLIEGHIVYGRYVSTTLEGRNISIKSENGNNILINGLQMTVDGANIISPDMVAENGVIHTIDAVTAR